MSIRPLISQDLARELGDIVATCRDIYRWVESPQTTQAELFREKIEIALVKLNAPEQPPDPAEVAARLLKNCIENRGPCHKDFLIHLPIHIRQASDERDGAVKALINSMKSDRRYHSDVALTSINTDRAYNNVCELYRFDKETENG